MTLQANEVAILYTDGLCWSVLSDKTYASKDITAASFNSITGLASTAPVMDGTQTLGTSTLAARQDHVHPVDTSRYAASNPSGFITSSGSITGNAATATTASAADAATLNLGTVTATAINLGTASSTQTVNIGTGSGTTTINIGGAGDTVAIAGTLTTVNTTNTNIADKLITLNKGGAAASGDAVGLEVEENSAITGYAKVGNSRSSWTFATPAKSGSVLITPSAGAFSSEVVSSATANRVITLPDATGTLALTSLVRSVRVPFRWYYETPLALTDNQPVYRIDTASTLKAISWFRNAATTVTGTTTIGIYKNSSGTALYTITVPTAAASNTWTDAFSGLSVALAAGVYLEVKVTGANATLDNLTIQLDIEQAAY